MVHFLPPFFIRSITFRFSDICIDSKAFQNGNKLKEFGQSKNVSNERVWTKQKRFK
jgi:hypothetical protein